MRINFSLNDIKRLIKTIDECKIKGRCEICTGKGYPEVNCEACCKNFILKLIDEEDYTSLKKIIEGEPLKEIPTVESHWVSLPNK